MTHDDSTRRDCDEALVCDALVQAFDAPLTSAALADGEAAVRSLAASMATDPAVVDIGGRPRRRRRVAAAVAAGVFVVSSGAAAAGGGDPWVGARRVLAVIAPSSAPHQSEVEPRLGADEDDDRSDRPAPPLAPNPSTTTSTGPSLSKPVSPRPSERVIDQPDRPESQPSDTEAEQDYPDSDHAESDDEPAADESDHDTDDQHDAEAERHRVDEQDDDNDPDDPPDGDSGDPSADDVDGEVDAEVAEVDGGADE